MNGEGGLHWLVEGPQESQVQRLILNDVKVPQVFSDLGRS